MIKGPHGGVTDRGIQYRADDIRFTTNGKSLYIIQLGSPEPEQNFVLTTFAQDSIAADVTIKSVKLIGSREKISWSKQVDGLHLAAPKQLPNEMALVYKAKIKK